jgi:hypothetical protein
MLLTTGRSGWDGTFEARVIPFPQNMTPKGKCTLLFGLIAQPGPKAPSVREEYK